MKDDADTDHCAGLQGKRPSWTTMSLRTTARDLISAMLKFQHPKFTQNPHNGNMNELPTRRS